MIRKLIAAIMIIAASGAGASIALPLADAQPTCVVATPTAEPTTAPAETAEDSDSDSSDTGSSDTASSETESAEQVAASELPCADALAYPGPFTSQPEAQSSGRYARWLDQAALDQTLTAPPSPEVPVSVVDEPDPLAHSGSESFVLAYFGTGLIAFGAVALGSRRRFFRDDR